ncbi:hypothetical protein PspLS_10142 [Pyricularia sp. CBS 133598]|nr:hypothetical protein PspLS_10142 [Pyricularia sp. CBS 133598]
MDEVDEKDDEIPDWEREEFDKFEDLRLGEECMLFTVTNEQAESCEYSFPDALEVPKSSEQADWDISDDPTSASEMVCCVWMSVAEMAVDLPNSQARLMKLVNAMYSLGPILKPFDEGKKAA